MALRVPLLVLSTAWQLAFTEQATQRRICLHWLSNGLISPIFNSADYTSSCQNIFANAFCCGRGGGSPRDPDEGINRHSSGW